MHVSDLEASRREGTQIRKGFGYRKSDVKVDTIFDF